MSNLKAVTPELFYGAPSADQDKIDAIIRKSQSRKRVFKAPKYMRQLLGPSKTWKIFKKQQEALDACFKRRNDLMCFAYEQLSGQRSFLIAHPKVFWAVDSSRLKKNRSSYEVIREFSVSKLYFDIEFEYEHNKLIIGDKMLSNFLRIVNENLKLHFNIICNEEDILDLDSSTPEKYSHHVIYQMKNVAFENNYAVGNFVKMICSEMKETFQNSEKMEELCKKYKICDYEVREFFVKDRKGTIKLFIDEGVYTKNRHFRLLGSSKIHKNAPLIVSAKNKYKANAQLDETEDCSLFLDSLITYFSPPPSKVLDFGDSGKKIKNLSENHPKMLPLKMVENPAEASFTAIDKFIESLIHPNGRIRRKCFFSSNFVIVYDIQGYRFCHNIGREHKSNNIKFIVSLNHLTYHQKCYDPDCGDFKSHEISLPAEIRFLFEDDFDCNDDNWLFKDYDQFDEDLVKAADLLETKAKLFSDNDDTELCEITDCIEEFLNESSRDFYEL